MAHEIEIKLKYADKEKIIARLQELKAKFREKYDLADAYFSLTHTDMSNAHDLVRIRQKNEVAELTFKGKCETEGHIWKRIELSTGIGDPESMLQILTYLRFNKISENKSHREFWDLGNVEIAFINFIYPDKIDFIEIEGPSEEEIEVILVKLGDLVTKVGEEGFKKFDEKRKKGSCAA